MYLLTQLWMFLSAALALGALTGFVVKRWLVHRRLQAVQYGAWVEQQAREASMAHMAQEHREALGAQSEALRTAMAAAEAARLQAVEVDHAQALDRLQQRAHDELASLVRAHDAVQAEARVALQRAQADVAAETATRCEQEIELARLRLALDALREQLADTLQRQEQVLAEAVEQARAEARAQRDAQSQAYEHALAAEREALSRALQHRNDEPERLQHEAAQLREQFDALLVELSAAARARDARDAQRVQLARELAIEVAARRREAEISQAQRSQLRERVVQVGREALDREAALRAQCDTLHQQLLASRRTTKAAVLAARQRELRMEAALGQLREQLGEQLGDQGGGASVHVLARVA